MKSATWGLLGLVSGIQFIFLAAEFLKNGDRELILPASVPFALPGTIMVTTVAIYIATWIV
eukprot:TRINITY_DN7068_c0_g1_i1.p1 TRINITY_DN7068_c0_g1~~TRINITY_DN7068_c0_g1_i1.p1  ORF type:complete len:61 (-),score=2.24 TRINITY_DN7068_c0_g1_i1:148-330(-)